MKLGKKILTATLMSLGLMSTQLQAATDTATLSVTATVLGSCSFLTPSDTMAFGTYDSAVESLGTASFGFSCGIDNVDYDIEANNGANYDVANSVRRMSDGAGNFLPYGLFQDAARTQELGTVANGTSLTGTTGLANNPSAVTIYGKIPVGQAAPAGSYSDTVTITLVF